VSERSLTGRVALVAGATRGCGRAIAVELGRAGATVYATGRSSRTAGRSEVGRPETIEETGERVAAAGGDCIALRVDHLDPEPVRALVARIERDHGRLDLLVNDAWGGDTYLQFGKPLWELDLMGGLRMLRLGIDSHAITSHFALPLLIRRPGGLVIEMTDGDAGWDQSYRPGSGFFYDLVKHAVIRMALAQSVELAPHGGSSIAVTPGWLRSEQMLDAYGVKESNWRDATKIQPHFCISESPLYVARAVAALAADPEVARWSGQLVSSGQLAPIYDFRDADGTQPDCWRYLREVQGRGLPADDRGYR
jgi:NAD(P)-dependent dehydrogenase (short-subunit alcohol dehydrogenase family)